LRSFDRPGWLRGQATIFLASTALASTGFAADGKTHRIAIPVDFWNI